MKKLKIRNQKLCIKHQVSNARWVVTVYFLLFTIYCLLFTISYAQDRTAVITSFGGNVKVKLPKQKEWIMPKVGMELGPGGMIKTGAKSYCVLKFSDEELVKLISYTNFIINEAYVSPDEKVQRTSLQLFIGKVYTYIKRAILPGSSFNIRTPAAIIGVRGTLWETNVLGNGDTYAVCLEGKVNVSAAGVTITLEEGYSTTVRVGQPPEKPKQLTDEEKEEKKKETEDLVLKPKEVIPTLVLTSPKEKQEFTEDVITISGITDPENEIQIHDIKIKADKDGKFSAKYTLRPHLNTIVIKARNKEGNINEVKVKVYLKEKEVVDTIPPELVITSPEDGLITNKTTLEIIGKTEVDAKVKVEGVDITIAADGSFTTSKVLIAGENKIRIEAQDKASNITTKILTVTQDIIPPYLILTQPQDNITVSELTIQVIGTTEKGTKVKINGVDITVTPDGGITHTFVLKEGENIIKVEAQDKAGNITTIHRNIYYDATPLFLTVSHPPDYLLTDEKEIDIIGFTKPGAKVYINGEEKYVNPTGEFKVKYQLVYGKNIITIKAEDKTGKQISVVKQVEIDLPVRPPGE